MKMTQVPKIKKLQEILKKNEPVSKTSMKINDQLLFSFSEKASLEVRAEIISPTEAAAFAAAAEAGELRDCPPTALAIGEYEVDELLVFLGSPRAFFNAEFVAARLPAHFEERIICGRGFFTNTWRAAGI